jgi:cyclopropane-fatty-acyl-phospholipid synthase
VTRAPATAPVAPRLAALLERVSGVGAGELPVRLRAWDGSEAGPAGGPVLVLRSRRALRRLLWRPDELGLARAYVTGDVDVAGDLDDGLRRVWSFARAHEGRADLGVGDRLAALGIAARLGAVGPPPRTPATEARVRGRLHSRARDRDVIAHHYDFSNEFYALVLDEHLAYSCAYFGDDAAADVPLADAQRAKFDLVCDKLQLRAGTTLLDVGCGWGSLSIHAARRRGVRVTGITLSRQQLELARKRAAEEGVADLVDLRWLDYRDLRHAVPDVGSFDAAASLEMGEHVGDEHYPEFVRTVHDVLRPGGRFLVQQMSRVAGTAPGGGAFIEAYIAPDMHMRPLGETVALLEAGGFEVRGVQALREHYVRTGEAWRATLEANWDEVVAMVGEESARVWRLYLAGGALAFAERRMGVDQILVRRPEPVGSPASVRT